MTDGKMALLATCEGLTLVNYYLIKWICGAKLEDEISSAVLLQKLDLDEITAVLRTQHASTPSRVWRFQAPEIVGGQGRRGPRV